MSIYVCENSFVLLFIALQGVMARKLSRVNRLTVMRKRGKN
jgi:hypothetical protein